ncbi:MAG: M14-type cytosolic carboxypeptidase [Myxococcota bacterium]
MQISAAFDSGNIERLNATDPQNIQVRIRPDVDGRNLQWFYFRLTGARGVSCRIRITNAGQASYARAWKGFQAVCSSDLEHWPRVETAYHNDELILAHTPESDVVWFAMFAPYPLSRHQRMLPRWVASGARLSSLGITPDGHDLDVLTVGRGPEPIWIVARQHPAEVMAEWFAEGLLERLLERPDEQVNALTARATLYVVPNMNPDGSARGHLRTNAMGADLNRSWLEPSLEKSPEVYWVREEMRRTGVSICLDVHGDEAIPYCFISKNILGVPGLNAIQRARYDGFLARMEGSCAEFQTAYGYPQPRAGQASIAMCSTWLTEVMTDTLAVTLEQPFKDNADRADPVYGWTPARSRRLGAETLTALLLDLEAR